MVKAKELFIATRPWSFPMSIISVSIGSALAVYYGYRFDWYLYLLVLLGTVFLHAFTNVINDYFDYKSGVDREGAPTTKYRPHPIIAGFLSPTQTLVFALSLFLIGSVIGLYLTILRGIMVLIIGGIGVLLALFYTAPPIKFKYRALGEVGIFFAFGPTMVLGGYYVQTMEISFNVFLASVPIGILIALVAFSNNLRDVEYDSSVNIKTLPAILGVDKSVKFFFITNVIAIAWVPILVLLNILPLTTLISVISIFNVLKLVKLFRKKIPENADPLAAQTVLVFGILLLAGLVLNSGFSIQIL